MQDVTASTTQPLTDIPVDILADLRLAGCTAREIHRLQVLRDCLDHYPHIEYFTTAQWRRLKFMKWRYERGDYGGPRPVDRQTA